MYTWVHLRDKRLHVRVSAGELEEWGTAASDAGLCLADWVRIVCENEVDRAGAGAVHPSVHPEELERAPKRAPKAPDVHQNVHPLEQSVHPPAIAPRASRERRYMCEHRILPGAYCRLCDRP